MIMHLRFNEIYGVVFDTHIHTDRCPYTHLSFNFKNDVNETFVV